MTAALAPITATEPIFEDTPSMDIYARMTDDLDATIAMSSDNASIVGQYVRAELATLHTELAQICHNPDDTDLLATTARHVRELREAIGEVGSDAGRAVHSCAAGLREMHNAIVDEITRQMLARI